MKYNKIKLYYIHMKIIISLIKRGVGFINRLWMMIIYIPTIPYRVRVLRKKEKIRVLFIVSEVSMWKTECLYNAMKQHPRFEAILLPAMHYMSATSKVCVEQYFDEKKYDYIHLNEGDTLQSTVNPDIIFYQQPYSDWTIEPELKLQNNRKSLFCHVNYTFEIVLQRFSVNQLLQNIAWIYFVENEITRKQIARKMLNFGYNLRSSGLPIMDELLRDNSHFPDRWKKMSINMKRIIYAPHHSVRPNDPLAWGSILEYGDFMLELAKKYMDKVQWIFKPHPFLYPKLCELWGKERTDTYYYQWSTMKNSQIETGPYLDLFKHSHALIHDCGSFLIEYLYTDRPAMYLFSQRSRTKRNISKLSQLARDLHYPAHTREDIEIFVLDVISGKDDMAYKRKDFKEKHLIPEGGSACRNIINAILGVDNTAID